MLELLENLCLLIRKCCRTVRGNSTVIIVSERTDILTIIVEIKYVDFTRSSAHKIGFNKNTFKIRYKMASS